MLFYDFVSSLMGDSVGHSNKNSNQVGCYSLNEHAKM